MHLESEDTHIARVESILRSAHALRDATVPPHPSGHPRIIGNVTVVSLPTPQPLLPSLLQGGIDPEIASATSQVYHRKADELRQHIQESISVACRKAAESPVLAHVSPPEVLMRRVVSIFTDIYFRRLETWKDEIIRSTKQTPKLFSKATPGRLRTFNQDYVPLLEHFFEENPFPTHADKVFLAQKSNMQYKQIHVWFQNRRNRTRKEGKSVKKKPTYEGRTKPLNKPHEHMNPYATDSGRRTPGASIATSSNRVIESEVVQSRVSKDVFTLSSPPHAFPSAYPPACPYDPFPCKTGTSLLSKPQWRRAPDGKKPPLLSISVDDLVERFSLLNVRCETRSRGSSKLQSHAATVAITITPSPAPHPALMVCKYSPPVKSFRPQPLVRAPITHLKVFENLTASKALTLASSSVPRNVGEPVERKVAPLPRRFSGRQNNSQDTTPSDISPSSSSPHLSSTDSDSSSDNSSAMTPDIGSDQELSSFGSPCHSPLDRLYPIGYGEVDVASLVSAS